MGGAWGCAGACKGHIHAQLCCQAQLHCSAYLLVRAYCRMHLLKACCVLLCDMSNGAQGLNRVQQAPQVSRAMHSILNRCQRQIGSWVGSSVIHLGDHNVPNALMFIDKYTQVSWYGQLQVCLQVKCSHTPLNSMSGNTGLLLGCSYLANLSCLQSAILVLVCWPMHVDLLGRHFFFQPLHNKSLIAERHVCIVAQRLLKSKLSASCRCQEF